MCVRYKLEGDILDDFASNTIIHAVSDRGKYIAIPAFALALAGAYYVAIMIYRWLQARRWLPAEGIILEINDPSVVGSQGSSLVNRKKIYAKYEFNFQGSRFTGKTISAGVGYEEDLHVALFKAFEDKETITVFFDPKNPEKSIVNRNLFWPELIVLAALCIVGLVTGIKTIGLMGS